MKVLLLLICLFLQITYAKNYPSHWWAKVPDSERQGSWEILPHEVKPGAVILSKRNELGIFSNFANTPIKFEGKQYASIEGLWQMMKFPDSELKNDPRKAFKNYPYTRQEVMKLSGFEAKKAGDLANKINESNKINWVSYQGQRFNYKDHKSGSAKHYRIMYDAIKAKVDQNQAVKDLLIKTKGLILKPDHYQGPNAPKSYQYFDILMKIRDLN